MIKKCIFCKILAGQVPCSRIWEDERTLAFLDVSPIIKGHTLVIPKRHIESIDSAEPGELSAVAATVQRVARAQYGGLGAAGINVLQNDGATAGQVVPHLHVHLIPRFTCDDYQWNWNPVTYANQNEMDRVAADITAGLRPDPGRDD